jgi:hypothetical protein
MALTAAQHIAELTKRFPLCGPREAEETFFYAFQEVVREHPWPWCIAESRIVTDEEYMDGTVAVTNGSLSVTGTGTTWVASWATAPSMRRIIIEGRSEAYLVSSIAGAGSLTLANSWVGASGSALDYRMFRDIYALPSNCGFGGEYILIDPENQRAIKLKNYGTMIDRMIPNYGTTDLVQWASRVALTSTGIPQLQLYPPPSDQQVFIVLYFRSATKPASLTAPLDPLFPADCESLIWKRMLAEFAKDPRHKRSDWRDFQNEYDDALLTAKGRYDGGNELDVRLQTTYPDIGDYLSLTIGAGDPSVLFST